MLHLLSAGGVVMFPLLGFSLLAVALILERLYFWFRILKRQDKVVRQFLTSYRRNPKSEVLDKKLIPSLQKNADLPVPRIFLAALELEHPNPEDFRLALECASQAELPLLKRFNTVFETIISVAPLLGLLGTVLGLINSFASLKIGDVGSSNTTGVTGGISEALISTATGLVVAMFTLLFANTFRGLYQRQRALILEYGGHLELLYRHRYEQKDNR
ncbi:MAG TPA: MotA/TolQ/ExbB proton channel family protein [Kamptonema sp.]|nr:MotA/TolQ/ExbB proton channel family protein [Kamptonema sp.]